jgi:hypothetical protein
MYYYVITDSMKHLFTLLLFFCYFAIDGQVIQLGSGSTDNSIQTASPVNTYYRRQVAQFVYTTAEINTAGANGANVLSQLGFYVTANPVYAIPGYTVKIKHTTQTNVSSALGTGGWTTVKNAFSYTPSPGGYDMIIFDTPFNWDGVQNIAVEICWSQIQPTWDASGQCRIYTTTSGYRYRRDDNGGSICGSSPTIVSNNKPQAQLVFKTSSTWNGSVNSDWFNNSNWDIGVPDSELDVIIPSGATNMPSITGAGAACKNLTINSGATMTLSGSNSIEIYRNWTNNGTFVANTGNVTLKGTAVNSINGANNQDLYDLTIDNVNGAVISSGSINLRGSLNVGIATGNFNTNNSLKIVSNASGTGRISELTTKCLYTLDMSDTYGDSWNGGFITVLIDGVVEGTYFAKGSNSTSNFIAAVGSTVQLNYTAGIYEFENSYILYDGGGTAIFSDGTTPATGTNVFNTVSNCSFFNPITGDITMERYINGGITTWNYLTSAVSGTTIADFNDDFATTGFTGADDPLWPTAANPWASIYFYNEAIPGVIDSGFVAATNVTNAIGVGQGFWAYIDGANAFTIDVVGPPNVGDINLPISYTNNGTPASDGWNMVGNPFPSTIDWDSPNITKTNMNNAIYIWNPDLQQFASYVFGIGTNGGSKNIASSQAFWVQANGPGAAVQVTEASKTSVDAAFLKQNSVAPLRIKTQNNFGTDELVINFESNSTIGFDAGFDAEKIASSNANLPLTSSIFNDVDFSINQLNSQEVDIPIKILTGVSGTHNITIENAALFNNVSCLILEDVFNNTSYDLSVVSSFSTFIYDTTTTARFLLHIGAPKAIEITDASCFGNNDGKIVFTKNSSSPFDIIWKNNLNTVLSSNNNIMIVDSINNLSEGNYYIETTDLICGNSIDTVTISEPMQITSQFTSNVDTLYLSSGGSINFTNQSNNANYYLWDFGDFNTSSSFSPGYQYNLPGIYLVSLFSHQNNDCFEIASKNITVIDDLITSINNATIDEKTKVWINNNQLNITGKNITKIDVRNILGEILFSSYDNNVFNLAQISNQVLIVTTFDSNKVSSHKVNFVKH